MVSKSSFAMRAPALLFAAACFPNAPLAQASAPAPAATPAAAPETNPADLPLGPGEGRAVAGKLAAELVKLFVVPENAVDYAAMLRANAAAGRYDEGTRSALADLLTDDLQAVHKDGHLHVELARPEGEDAGPAGGAPAKRPPMIQSARTIAPGIGYIRFTAFTGRDDELAGVRKWLAENAKDKVLIFDLRNHHGGGLAEQDAIFSYLFATKTPLVKMSIAKALAEDGGFPFSSGKTLAIETEGDRLVATHSAMPGADTPLRKAKVYLLVSNKSVSAAEHFALAMKSTGRATLIGEATGGANHFGGPRELNDHFAVWMPIGRTYDIKTGKDWEADGVQPDIEVDPKLALVKALELAGLRHDEAVRLDAQEVPAEPVHADKLRAR
jgi:hypothetical protein